RAIRKATGCAALAGRPSATNGPASWRASAGSAIAPRPSEQMVMPSCAPAIMRGIWFIADSAQAARRKVAAIGSMMVRRDAMSANSAPTKNALPSSRPRATRISITGGLRRPDHPYLFAAVLLDFDDGELP